MFRNLVIALFLLCPTWLPAEDYAPDIKSASDEGERAIQGFKVPEGMQVQLFAAEPLLANPVAFCINEQGRVYVCETFRQGKGVEDNRGHMNWLEDDLALQTVAERVAMFRKYLGDAANDYTKEDDRIRLLTDTDGDGRADTATIFVQGFNHIEEGTGAGVLAIEGDVYYTCIPRLWRFRDEDGDGQADVKDALHDGYGVRVAFRGHDMHGLTLGPDGRLYFSIGDRGYNVLSPEGTQLVRPDCGAVFRCERDGSQLEIFAYGLRNPQELAFDDFGNLFTGDNNSDSGDKARWVHVVEGGDTGWRMYYQYLEDRGPWNREHIWHPWQETEETALVQPASTIPPILNLGDGPSGLVYYPGVGLPERYQGHFFLADFRGGAGNSGIRSFALQPKGASFEVVDSHWFIQSILATDVDFGYDGKMYLADWVDGWNGPGKGRIYTFAMPEQIHAADVKSLMSGDFHKQTSATLVDLLNHADRRVRQRAQFALVAQGQADELAQVATNAKLSLLARIHATWGLGQLLRQQKTDGKTLLQLLFDEQPEIRTQAAVVLGDARSSESAPALIKLLATGAPREQYAVCIALGRIGNAQALSDLIGVLERNADQDPIVRHAAIMGLVGCGTVEQLLEFEKHPSASVRLALVVALRRHHSPEVARFLAAGEQRIVEEAARAIHDEPIMPAMPALAQLADRPGMSDLLQRRVMNANFRLGGPEQAAHIAVMAGSAALPDHLRLEAMQELLQWDNPPKLDRVTNEFRPLVARSLDEAREPVRQSLGSMLSGSDKLRETSIQLAARYGIQDVGPELVTLLENKELSAGVRVQSLSALGTLQVKQLDQLVQAALKDQEPLLRSEARRILAITQPELAVTEFAKVLQTGTPSEQQSAIQVLSSLKSAAADKVLLAALTRDQAGQGAPEIALDLLLAAEQRATAEFTAALAQLNATRDTANPLSMYRECLTGGDASRGREVFFGNAAASCRRCHKVNGNGGEVGPDLSGVAKDKLRDYLLESIVNPNAKIAKGFETVIFAMDDGRVLAGIVRTEDDTTFRIVTPTGETIVVPKEQVEETAKGKSGMPEDLLKQLTKSNIRDLVEYLSTLQTPVTTEGH